MTESEFLVNASGHFLAEEYPNEALYWPEHRRADYCETFKCEDFEYFTGDQLHQIIEVLSHEIKEAYQKGLQERGHKT